MCATSAVPGKPVFADLVAGLSVALVAIPQSMAYAELAGMPAYTGLYAVGTAALAAAFFASSPYLQTGPVATTSLLTFGVLSQLAVPGGAQYVAYAGLLALVVGVTRVLVGVLRLGSVAYLLSQPVLSGFMSAAALLIVLSQLPAALGVPAAGHNVVLNGFAALVDPAAWRPAAALLALVTVLLVRLGRRVHPLFPGVLVAVVLGIVYSTFFAYGGARVGQVPAGLPPVHLVQPWGALPQLFVGGVVIALVGFAEAASIARTYATQERSRWRANREFIGQGVANLAAGLFGGFPVGGSFARSSVNRLAGAKTRWSGAVTGLAVLAFLPFTFVIAPLPKAVLGAVVIAAVSKLLRLRELWAFKDLSRPQALLAWTTFLLTLLLAPRVDYALLAGIGLAVAVHLWREQRLVVRRTCEGATLTILPLGVLWFGSAFHLEDSLSDALAEYPQAGRLVLDLGGLGRVDLSGALALKQLLSDAREAGLEVALEHVPPFAEKWLTRLWLVAPSPLEHPEH